MKPYYIYMIELRLEGKDESDEAYFYIGKTKNITDRLITHISRNNRTTKLIKGEDNNKKARVVAICDICKIIFDDEDIKLIDSKETPESDNLIDSITSKIENKFLYDNIVGGKWDIDKNKKRYRGGHYTDEWGSTLKSYIPKKISEYKPYNPKSVLDERYVIEDKFYEEYNVQQKEVYKEKIKKDIQEIIKE